MVGAVELLLARIFAGDLRGLFGWLEQHIWRQASRWRTDDLALRASGEALNPAHWRRHLEQRYAPEAG